MTLEGFTREAFDDCGITHDVYRYGSGPAVLVLAEIPGITPKAAAFGRRVADQGLTAVLPHMFGTPGREPSAGAIASTSWQLCVSKEFSWLALGRTAPIVDWLRALARAEHRRCGGPGVGVVGMCFTGGFGLAMAADEAVLAPVLSQPSLPVPMGRARRAGLQMSDADWDRVQDRARSEGFCVLGLRFTGDRMVPDERFSTLRRRLGDSFLAVELDSSPGNPHGHPQTAHSVLTEHLQDEEGTPTRAALDQVLEFLSSRLLEPAG